MYTDYFVCEFESWILSQKGKSEWNKMDAYEIRKELDVKSLKILLNVAGGEHQ